jgi:O-antigen ligase
MIRSRMDILTVAAWAAALFLSSTLFSHDVALRLILLAVTLLLVAAATAQRRGALKLLPPVWLPFLLWGLWAALSLTWSIDVAASEKELRNEIVYAGLALLVCHAAAQAPRAERIFLPVTALAAAMLCASALRDFLASPHLGPEGWHGGPGDLSSILLIVLPCAVMAGWYAMRTRNVWLAAGAVAITACALAAGYATLNRTLWVGFTLQGLVAGALFVLRPATPSGRRSLRAAAVAIVLVIVMGGAMAALTHQERLQMNEVTALEADPRLAAWAEALSLIGERPATGYGFGRGMLHEPLTRAAGPMLWHSHNLFIDVTLQTGMPGLLLLLLLLGCTAAVGWRLSRSSADAAVACGAAMLAIILGMMARNMTDVVWLRHPALAYWSALGVLMAWGWKQQKAEGA